MSLNANVKTTLAIEFINSKKQMKKFLNSPNQQILPLLPPPKYIRNPKITKISHMNIKPLTFVNLQIKNPEITLMSMKHLNLEH